MIKNNQLPSKDIPENDGFIAASVDLAGTLVVVALITCAVLGVVALVLAR